jgi:alkylation response protein AidB-like acyl-CoA dehydrogenase
MNAGVTAEQESLVAAAEALAPTIVAYREQMEQERRLPLTVVEALRQAGAFRTPMPRAWGGPEADPLTTIRVIEALSRADGSVGWCVMIGCDGGYFTAFLDQDVAREMYPDLDAVSGGVARPVGRAVAVPGGYRVSGRWPFASGCQHSDWMSVGCMIYDDEAPRRGPDGAPEWRMCMTPAATGEVIDTWTSTGLRGSGSHDYALADVFIPEERTFSLLTSPIRRDGPLYQFRRIFLAKHLGVPLGIARAAIDALTEMAQSKPSEPGMLLRDEPHIQAVVAEADALVGAARAYTFDVIGDLWATLVAGDEPSAAQRARFRLCIVQVHRMCVEAVDLMYHAAGGSAVYAGHPLDRCLRDIRTIYQHAVNSPRTYTTAGKVLLGLPAGVPFL